MLRGSRLAQVYKSGKPFNSSRPKNMPTHQIIETKPNLLKFQEWGLKSSLPSKIRSQYLVFNELDTLERMTDFEPRGGAQWNQLRIKELGLSPSYNANTKNPLFNKTHKDYSSLNEIFTEFFFEKKHSSAIHYNDLSNSKKMYVQRIRKEFKEWLAENHPSAIANQNFINPVNMLNYAKEFIENYKAKNSMKFNSSSSMVGTGGLTYALQGRLKNSPNGVIQKKIVPGRFVATNNDNKIAAIGGFVANASTSSNVVNTPDKWYSMRDKIYAFDVSDLSVNNANITLDAKGTWLFRQELKNSYRKNYAPKPLYGARYPSGDRKSDVAESLKAILEFNKS